MVPLPLPSQPSRRNRAICCRSYSIWLDKLSYRFHTTEDLVLGMHCLLRAFAPELAGETLEQVSCNVGRGMQGIIFN